MKTGLAALIHPKSNAEFLDSYSKNLPFVIHANQAHLLPLTSLPFLQSLEILLKSWPTAIQAHLPDVRDEASSIDTTPKDAQKLFDNGMGLLFNEAQTLSPVLQMWIEDMRKDLGLSSLTYGR